MSRSRAKKNQTSTPLYIESTKIKNPGPGVFFTCGYCSVRTRDLGHECEAAREGKKAAREALQQMNGTLPTTVIHCVCGAESTDYSHVQHCPVAKAATEESRRQAEADQRRMNIPRPCEACGADIQPGEQHFCRGPEAVPDPTLAARDERERQARLAELKGLLAEVGQQLVKKEEAKP